MTIPPLLSTLQAFNLTTAESSLFSKFQARGFWGAVIKHSGLSKSDFYTNVGAHTPFSLLHLPGLFTIQPSGIPDQHLTWLGTLDASPPNQEAQRMIVEQIDTLSSKGVFPNDTTEFLYFTNHSPFRLYVSAEDIKNEFYRDLYALQGQQSTFWTGSAWVTQDSSLIWNFTETQVLPAVVKALRG